MSVLVVWYIRYNVSFDTHHPDKENIYRLVSKDINNGNLSFGNPLPMADAIRTDYPGEGIVAGVSSPYDYPVTVNNNELIVKASYADAEIFKILDFYLQAGSSESVINEPNNAIITNSCSKKLFGTMDPLGQMFTLKFFGGEILFTVKGVVKDYPGNSAFKPEMILSWQSMNPPNWRENWWWGGTSIFIKVINTGQKNDLERKINTILERHNAPFIEGRYEYKLLPFAESHFRTDIDNAFSPAISSRLLWTLGIVALFIIGIACINFINLAFSQSEKNAKEAGIRKVSGASQNDLTIRFLTIPLQKALIAMLPAIVFITFLSEPFKNLAQFDSTSPFNNPMIWFLIIGMILLTGLLSGFYPAVSLAKSNPVEVLYNKQNKNTLMGFFRNTLVIIQLVIANILIIASFFIFKQITFMKNHDLGFNKEGLIALEVSDLDSNWEKRIQKLKVLKQEIMKQSASGDIMGMCETEAIPGSGFRNGFTVYDPNNWDSFTVKSVGIDENYSSLFEIPLAEGKNFGRDISSEKDAVLINETFKRQLNWNSIEDKYLTLFNKNYKIPVIGVLKDVHINSLNQAIPPMIYRY
ncbi:ABC transporter permease, partial [bacterium]|nr:ABC transporter permease [bacterium]